MQVHRERFILYAAKDCRVTFAPFLGEMFPSSPRAGCAANCTGTILPVSAMWSTKLSKFGCRCLKLCRFCVNVENLAGIRPRATGSIWGMATSVKLRLMPGAPFSARQVVMSWCTVTVSGSRASESLREDSCITMHMENFIVLADDLAAQTGPLEVGVGGCSLCKRLTIEARCCPATVAGRVAEQWTRALCKCGCRCSCSRDVD